MREKLNNIIHSRVFIVILMLVFICVTLLVGTYAWFTWNSSDNTKLVMSIGRVADVVFTNGNDIKSDLTPVFNYTDGLSTSFTINNRDTSGAIIGYNVNLNITTIADELVSKDVKWTLVKDNEVIKDGDLSTASNGVTVTLYNGALSTGITSYTLYLYIDGNVENDPNMMGKTINGSIMVEASDSGVNLLNNITNLYTNADKTEVINNSITYNYAPSVNLMNDRLGDANIASDSGNIRYYGANPNNYIYFNCSDYNNQSSSTCETWRIIGIVDGKVKIIKEESIGSLSWDNDDNSNNWSTSTLNTYLNGDYYNSLNTKNSQTIELISKSTYYLGGFIASEIYSDQIYNYERTNEEGITIISGNPFIEETNIGLMYASDYGYATDFNKCSNNLGAYYDEECYSNDWLFYNNDQWLITPGLYYSDCVWFVQSSGGVISDSGVYGVYDAFAVRPVLYLDLDVMVNKGNGSSDNPYQIYVETPKLIEHITSLYTSGNPTLITQATSGDTYYYSYQSNDKTWGLMNDGLKVAATSGTGATTITNTNALTSGTEGNIRYFGPSDKVNNYIYFNCSDYSNQSSSTCEKWRIIGIVDGKVKLIRDESIGQYAWDANDHNKWSISTLNSHLNKDYYNSLNTKNSKTIGLISESTYYLGGYSTPDGLYPNDIYNYERTNEVGTTIYSGNPFTVNSNIGLMYASDYGYATDLNKCRSTLEVYDDEECYSNDWLFNAEEWLITPKSTSDSDAWFVQSVGRISPGVFTNTDSGLSVRSVLYLNIDLMVGSGDGSSSSPYQLYV